MSMYNAPMRIGFNAHLLSFAPGYRRAGVSQYSEQLLRSFAGGAIGADDTLAVYLGPGGQRPVWLTDSERVALHPARLPTGHAPGRILWEQSIAPVASRRDRLDVLFCPVNVVPLLGTAPAVVTVHDLAFLAHPEAFHASKRRYLSAMTRLSVRRARRVIAVSAHTKEDLIRSYGVAPEKISVIPNAMDARF